MQQRNCLARPPAGRVSASKLVGEFAQRSVMVGRLVMRDRPPVIAFWREMESLKESCSPDLGLAEIAGALLLCRSRVQGRLINQVMLSNTPLPRSGEECFLYVAHFSVSRLAWGIS